MALQAFLDSNESPKVIMLCGMAGSGKSTLAKQLATDHGFIRLSVDHILADEHGRYGIDYLAEDYERLSIDAIGVLEQRMQEALEAEQNVVLDRSFWSLDDCRSCYRALKDVGVSACCLVYLRAGKEFLWDRIQARKKETHSADNAIQLSRELFEQYWTGFNVPNKDENPIIIDVDAPV